MWSRHGSDEMSESRDFYTSLNLCLRAHFGQRVWRVPVSLHRRCPHRMAGQRGCVFCLPESYEPPAEMTAGSVREQLERGIQRYRAQGRAEAFIAYFQSGSNTCGELAELRSAYKEALGVPGIVALSIATRPDCLPEDVLQLLDELGRRCMLWVEIGVQSMHDRTLRAIERGHDAACARQALGALVQTHVAHVVAHMILGLPGEDVEDMGQSLREVCALRTPPIMGNFPRLGLKLHHLQVMRGTPLEKAWRAGEVKTLGLDEYAELVVGLLERVPRDVVIHRLCGEARSEYLCAPVWEGSAAEHVARIREEFRRRGTWQGKQIEGT